MHVLQSFTHLLHNRSRLFLRQLSFLLHLLQTAVGKSLNYQIQIFLIVEVPEERS